MKNIPHRLQQVAAAAVLLGAAQALGTTNIWTGASAPDLNWRTPGNWSTAVPSEGDAAFFFDAGAAGDATTINNVVDASLTAGLLWYGQTNGYHNTQVSAGATLVLSNTTGASVITAGTETQVSVTQTTTNAISGKGSVLVNNTNASLIARQAWNAAGGAHRAVLDMSGLDTFTASLGRILVGVGDSGNFRRSEGQLMLARTNVLALGGTAPQLMVGDNSGNNNGNSTVSRMWLGQSNALFVDSVRIGGQKQQGNLSFSNSFSQSSLFLRGPDQKSRASLLAFGDNSAQSGSGNPTTGTVDLGSGTVDVQADTVYLGRGQTGNGGGGATGTLTIGAGTMDVNNLYVGYQNSASAVGVVNGTLTVNNNGSFGSGATLVVNSNLTLARSAGASAAVNGTLNIGGGSVLVNGAFVNGGGATTIGLTNGLLRLPPQTPLAVNYLNIDGGVLSNATLINVSNALSVLNGGVISGAPVYDMGTSGNASWTFGSGLIVSNVLKGAGIISGDVVQARGASLIPGGNGFTAGMTLYNNLTLDAGKMLFDLSSSAVTGNDQINAYGSLRLLGTNDVYLSSLGGGLDTVNPYILINYYGGMLSGDSTYFRVAGPLARSRYTFTLNAGPSQLSLAVGGAGSATLRWVGDGSANTWDLVGAANWNNGTGTEKFYNLDAVFFDDSGSAAPAVNLASTVIPASIVLSNATKNYTINGSGSVGGGNLTNYGSGTFTLNNAGSNSFANVDIESGNVVFGGGGVNDFSAGSFTVNSGATASLANSGNNLFSPSLMINGTLSFNQPADASASLTPSGFGTLVKQGASALTLAGDNSSFMGPLRIDAGTLKAGSKTILSVMGNTVSSGATLDVNGINLGANGVTVSGAGVGGNGAIVNSGAAIYPALANVTMTGNTTFGGTGRWDLRAAAGTTADPSTASLSTGGQRYNLTKTGTNSVGLVSITVDPALADIDVQQGTLQIEGNTTSLGEPTRNLTVRAGATLQFYRCTNLLNKVFVLYGDGATTTVNNSSQTNTMVGPVTLNGDCIFNAGGNYLTNAGPMNGTGNLIKSGGSTLVLNGASTYSGSTTLSNGTLVVGAHLAGSGVTTYGGTLSGPGPILAPVTVAAGTLSPMGGILGTMNISNTLSLGGTCTMGLDKSGTTLTSDRIQGVTALTYGGTLNLAISGDALAAGDSFTLFQFGSASGAFAAITPATPGPGLAWDTSRLTVDGMLRVQVPPPTIGTIGIVGSNVIIGGTGGTAGATYYLLTATNVAQPLKEWTPVQTNLFGSGGTFTVTNTFDANAPKRFYLLQLP